MQKLTTLCGAHQDDVTLAKKIANAHLRNGDNILVTRLPHSSISKLESAIQKHSNTKILITPFPNLVKFQQIINGNIKDKSRWLTYIECDTLKEFTNELQNMIIYIYIESCHCLFNYNQATIQEHPSVAVFTAGTADIPVAEEASVTVVVSGYQAKIYNDAGINNPDKARNILKNLDENVIITCQGFEGMLPMAIAPLTTKPVISVPTSTGYGISADGTVALNTSLSACTPGIATMNIDNGFGAGAYAARICQQLNVLMHPSVVGQNV